MRRWEGGRSHKAVNYSKNLEIHPVEGGACAGFEAEEQHDLTQAAVLRSELRGKVRGETC